MSVRALLAGAQPLFLVGLRATLERLGSVVVGEAARIDDAVQLARDTQPEIAFLDYPHAASDVMAAIEAIRREHPEVKIVAFGGQSSSAARALESGAWRILQRSSTGPRELAALLDGLAGQAPANAPGNDAPKLSPRELEVVALVASGRSNKEVAQALGISVRTVETHRARVMQKLGLQGAAALTLWAIGKGLVRA